MGFVPFVEGDQPTMAAFNEKFTQAIEAAIAGGLVVETGSYVGLGGNVTVSLPVSGVPKFLCIFPDAAYQDRGFYVDGGGLHVFATSNNNAPVVAHTSVEVDRNTFSFTSPTDPSGTQFWLNRSGISYRYAALCAADRGEEAT